MGGQLANIESANKQTKVAQVINYFKNADKISIHTENTYHYHYLHDLGLDVTTTSSVTFTVKACNDAHIALSSVKGDDSKDTYEIVIGGWWDSQSVIRDCKQCAHMAEVRHPSHPVSCTEARPFWISWSNNYIRVGTGNSVGLQQFMSWDDPSPHPVNYIAVSTGFGSTGDWTFVKNSQMSGQFWIGASDLGNISEWVWMPSNSGLYYTNWFPGQPNNADNKQHCMVLDANSQMKWRDENCEEHKYFLCEKQKDQSPIVG